MFELHLMACQKRWRKSFAGKSPTWVDIRISPTSSHSKVFLEWFDGGYRQCEVFSGDPGSESEAEDNDPDNKISLPQEIASRGNMANQVSAIRLSELGPRISLELIKIEEEICSGEVLYHKYIHKSDEEVKDLRRARILRQ